SYGAFNSVQIAAMEPKALKAILAVAGTDDRYTDDVHYFGGALHLFENTWAVGMVSSNAMPAAPGFDVSSASARERFEARPWILRWLHEQTDGPYWRRGSLRPDYGRLRIPSFLVGGLLDGYHNFVPRIMRSAPAPSKGLLGPWPHAYPHNAHPGPRVDFRAMQKRWWDQWLNGRATGILDEPRVTYYSTGFFPPALRLPDLEDVPGEWRHLDAWPESAFEPNERFFLDTGGGKLSTLTGEPASLELRYFPSAGASSKTWAPNGDGSYGLDQRADDARGLSFETSPLAEEVAILGFARTRLWVSATAPVANWIVRLCDVAPDGTSLYVSKGVLNGTHRGSHDKPEALVPGEVYEIGIELHAAAHRFAPGHRIRLVVSNADWPVLWPSPYPMSTKLHGGSGRPSHLDLPIDSSGREAVTALPPPPKEPAVEGLRYEGAPFVWQTSRDEAGETTTFRFERGSRTVAHPAGFTGDDGQVMVATVRDREPANASLKVTSFQKTKLADGRLVEARGEGELSSNEAELKCDLEITLLENGKLVREKRWEEKAPRNLV
ncbi:MAG TPA: CocE/NonD family hydrolase, partial [Vicinamibacteria bacterium]